METAGRKMKPKNFTITVTEYKEYKEDNSIRLQGTFERIDHKSIIQYLEQVIQELKDNDYAKGLTTENGGYIDEYIDL